MNYTDAIQFLYGLQLFGAKFGLENTRKLARLAGNPQEKLRFIHVAGTNGKGSTCAMIESICRAAGLRVGLFTSPHLVAFGERIQVDRELISEAGIVRLVEVMKGLLGEFPRESHPTFFEVVTVMGLMHFLESDCDLVVWETGMGGRLDATNIVTPLVSVITNVQLDHQQWLGDTIARIAFEKAGIIKPGVPVVTAADSEEALAVIRETARQNGSPLKVIVRDDCTRPPLDTIELPLMGEHQKMNAALARAAVEAAGPGLPVTPAAVCTGLSGVRWAGRLQMEVTSDGRRILFDGAHNPDGAETLARTLQSVFPQSEPAFVLGTMRDKDWPTICRILAPLASKIMLAPVKSDRSARPDELRDGCLAANPAAEVVVCASLSEALERVARDPFVVVTGSLYFIGEAMERLQILPSVQRDERGLNDWAGSPIAQRSK